MLIRSIEKFLRQHAMAATRFGRLAAHDPRFVLDLRMGRIPRPGTEARIRRWMENYRPERIDLIAAALQTKTFETKGYAHAS